MEITNGKLAVHTRGGKTIQLQTICAIYAFILTVAACLIGIRGSSSLTLVIIAMFAPLILMPEILLGPVLFFSMFDEFLLAGSGSSASRFMTLFFIFGAVLSILKKGTLKRASLYFVGLILFGVLLSFYATQGYASLPISYILNIILTITLINSSIVSAENLAKRLYFYEILALAFVYLLFMQNGFDSLVDGARMSISENVNSNELAMGLAVVMTLLVSDMLFFKRHALLNIFFIGANLVALFFTGSRTAMIAAITTSFLLYMISAQDKRSKIKAFFFLLFSAALLIVIYNVLEKNFPVLMERFTVENVEESGGTGRVDVWKNYFTHFFPKHWFLGMGFDPLNLYYGLVSLNVEAHGAHNLAVDILARSGVVGFVLYAFCFIKFYGVTLKAVKTDKFSLLAIAIVSTTLINGIGENVLTGRFLWFGIGLGYTFLNSTNKENKRLPGGNYGA